MTITPFVVNYETNGVILSSITTYVVMIIINLVIINSVVKLKVLEFLSKLIILLSSCFIMFIAVAAVYDSIVSNFCY